MMSSIGSASSTTKAALHPASMLPLSVSPNARAPRDMAGNDGLRRRHPQSHEEFRSR